ncbi:MAG: ribosomal protein S18-alanine N-acetyltransferase [Leucobacter sp.]
MRLRGASLNDLEAIWEIESEVFEADAWSLDMIREELSGDHRRYIVVEGDSGAVQGYAGLLLIGTDGDIQTIAVRPEARGGGHGRALMNALLDEAASKRATQVFLEVRADNPIPRELYKSLGFTELGVRPRYYQPDNVDAVVMRLEMKDR